MHDKFTDNAGASGHLPPPTAEEQRHSAELTRLIREEITASGGMIDFAHYMQLALYAAGLGYYSAGKHKLGAAGDFVTAPELGPVFGHCLAHQCQQVLAQQERGDILEVGAGSGALALHILQTLEALHRLPDTYFILETSPDLRQRQGELLQQQAPHLATRVHWLDQLPQQGFRGVVLANELLDAMPVQRFHVTEQGVQELTVAWQDEHFVWRERAADDTLSARVKSLGLAPGYTSEVNLNAEAWLRSIAAMLEAGVVLLIDYGFPCSEYYHPQRHQGTLMCHYRHRAHDNPLILTGLQDITTHIDFSALAEAGNAAGLSLLGYASQAAFLIALGLEQLVNDSDPDDARAHLELTTQIKKLTLPSEMGELFKVIAFGRDIDIPLQGFTLQDRRRSL